MKKTILNTLFIATLFATGFDSEDGAAIRQGVHVEWYRTIAPGNNGDAIFIWSDTRYGMRNIFAHKITNDGVLPWGGNGAIVTNLPGRQEDPVAIADGSGGVFIAWVDYRFDAEGDIFLQHLDTDGNLLLDGNGVALALVAGKQISINMCTDSLGGVFVTWQDKRGGINEDIYGTHVTANHDIVAPGLGVAIVVEGGNQNAKSIEYAGNNEAFIAWVDYREGANANIYGQRLNVSLEGTFIENGLLIANTTDAELKPRATFVNEQTSFVTWKQGDEDSKLFYQFVNETGVVFAESKQISDFDAIQTAPRVKRSTSGEIFVNWKDLRFEATDGDQFFQKIDVNGDIQWGDGVKLDLADDNDFSVRFTAGDTGDLNVVYERGTYPDVDIMFQNIQSDGTFLIEYPINISNADGKQFSPNILGSFDSGLFVIYADQGSGSIDLKVQKINEGPTPIWENGGLIAMNGLDGDIKYTFAFKNQTEDLTFFWEDNRATKKIYGAQLSDSNILNENGTQVSFSDNTSDDDSQPIVLQTETASYVGTYDASSTPKFLRINKINSEFENGWDSMGVPILTTEDMRDGSLIEIGDGIGCFWSESHSWTFDIYFQRFDMDGNRQFSEGGIELVDGAGDSYLLAAIPTPDNKILIFWMEEIWPNAVLKYTKIELDGSIEIGWNPNGNNLSDVSLDSRELQVKKINDGTGVIALWKTVVNFADITTQAIDWDGNKLWDENGVVVTDDANDQYNFSFEFNETHTKALVVWEDFINGQNFEITGQVLDLSDGSKLDETIQFTSVVLDTLQNFNPTIKLISGNDFFVVWEDERGSINEDPLLINGVDLYGAGYSIDNNETTGLNGVPICIAYHKQQDVNITQYSETEFFLDWIDYRSSGKEDLANYFGRTLLNAQFLDVDPACDCELPNQFSLKPAYPNPFNGNVNFDFSMPANEAVDFKIYDMTGRMLVDKLILPGFGGNYRVNWDGKSMDGQLAPSGVYFYKFSTSNEILKGKITYLK